MAEARKSALPLVRAWSGLDFDGANYSAPKKSKLENVFENELAGAFETTEYIVYKFDTIAVASPVAIAVATTTSPTTKPNLGSGSSVAETPPPFQVKANKDGYTVIPYSIEEMKKIIIAKNKDGTSPTKIYFSLQFFNKNTLTEPQQSAQDIEKINKTPYEFDFAAILADVLPPEPPDSSSKAAHRFVAYFKYMPTFGRTDEMLKGKLVAELAASQILDDAALSSIDVKDAAYRLVAYAKKVRGQEEEDPGILDVLNRLATDLSGPGATGSGDAGAARVDVPVENAIRRALIGKKLIPIRNMLMAKEDQEAGGKPTNIDAPTEEFERDAAAAWATPESARKAMVEMFFTTLGALFSTQQESKVEIGYTNNPKFDDATSKKTGYVSYGAILYSGRTKNFVEARVTKDSDETPTAVQTVKELFLRNALPINQVLLVKKLEELSERVKTTKYLRENVSTLARVENAREIDLPYELTSVYYGTASDSDYFGTGSNVSMMTDAAFIAARIINSLYAKGEFVPETTQDDDGQKYWKTPFLLGIKDKKAGDDLNTIFGELDRQISSSYTGHCIVRTADMGRVLGATLVLEPMRKKLSKTASDHGYVSMKTVKPPYRNLSTESAVALFYHQIWEKELGNHVVAQGGARLEESHMMAPFLVRVVTDSEHVVPTLCAYDDWIGPTDMFKRIEQTALMEIENYAHSRPSIKYAKGGRGRTLGDVGAWIKTESEESNSFYMTDLIRKVPAQHRDKAATCCAMLMTAVYAHTAFTEEVRKGGLARQRASETTVRELAARIAKIPV
jgi:hypothetical protein